MYEIELSEIQLDVVRNILAIMSFVAIGGNKSYSDSDLPRIIYPNSLIIPNDNSILDLLTRLYSIERYIVSSDDNYGANREVILGALDIQFKIAQELPDSIYKEYLLKCNEVEELICQDT